MEEAEELALWQGVTIAAGALFAMTFAAGTAAYVKHQHRLHNRACRQADELRKRKEADEFKKKKEAWVVDTDKCAEKAIWSEKSDAMVIEALRKLLEEEVTRCLVKETCVNNKLHTNHKVELNGHANCQHIASCLDDLDEQVLTGALLPGAPPTVRERSAPKIYSVNAEESSHGAAKWAASDPTAVASTAETMPPPPPAEKLDVSELVAVPGAVVTMPPSPPAERFDVGIMTEAPVSASNKVNRRFGVRSSLDSRAGAKHGQFPHVPEAAMKSWREKLHVMQQDLYEKDARTQQLHRQLRNCQQALWRQTIEERAAKRQIKDLLSDPKFSPQVSMAHASDIRELQRSIEDLSSRLADARSAEMQWSLIAKRQRAFFAQNGRASLEGFQLLKRHPAGEIFLALSMHDEGQGTGTASARRRPPPRNCHDTWEHIEEDDDDDFEDEELGHQYHDDEASPWESTDEDCRSPKENHGEPEPRAKGGRIQLRLPASLNHADAIVNDEDESQGVWASQPSGTARSL